MSLLMFGKKKRPRGYPGVNFFTGGYTGFLFDGAVSRVCTDSAGTTAASASGTDPAGFLEDLSGGNNHAIQGTTASKPVFYRAGGISSFRLGQVSAVNRFMAFTNGLNAAGPLSIIAVFKPAGAITGNNAPILSDYVNGWPGTNYFRFGMEDGSDKVEWGANSVPNASFANSSAAHVGNLPGIAIASRGDLVSPAHVSGYNMSGGLVDPGVDVVQNANPAANTFRIGYEGLPGSPIEVAYLLVINKGLSAAEKSTALAYLAQRFGGWA